MSKVKIRKAAILRTTLIRIVPCDMLINTKVNREKWTVPGPRKRSVSQYFPNYQRKTTLLTLAFPNL
jgi:hypothetical protein